jgi:hypothetical protein
MDSGFATPEKYSGVGDGADNAAMVRSAAKASVVLGRVHL